MGRRQAPSASARPEAESRSDDMVVQPPPDRHPSAAIALAVAATAVARAVAAVATAAAAVVVVVMRPCPDAPPVDMAVAVARCQRRAWWRTFRLEAVMVAGLLPFPFAAWPLVPGPPGGIGWLVFCNGVLCHGAFAVGWRHRGLTALYDTACNVLLCAFVNVATHWQPGTALLTALVAVVHVRNRPGFDGGHTVWSVCVHVVLVQWVLCFLLYVFVYELLA